MLECTDCKKTISDKDWATVVNAKGGYGFQAVYICDDCMKSDRWDGWKSQHWPNWPERVA